MNTSTTAFGDNNSQVNQPVLERPLGFNGKPLNGGPWYKITGVTQNNYEDESCYTIPKCDDPSKFGRMSEHHGLLVLIDGEGEVFLTNATELNAESAKNAEYKYASLNVPFSNGDPTFDQIKRLRQLSSKGVFDRDYHPNILSPNTVIEPAVAEAVDITGVPYNFADKEEIYEVEADTKNVGCYRAHNGLISVVDMRGQVYLLGFNDKNIESLETLGFRESKYIIVPFSIGEEIPRAAERDDVMRPEVHKAITYTRSVLEDTKWQRWERKDADKSRQPA